MTTFKDYTQKEKECLVKFLSAMYSVAKENNTGRGLRKQAEMAEMITTVLGTQEEDARELKLTGIPGIISNILIGVDNGGFSLLWRNAADIMQTCMEFAILGMDDNDMQSIEEGNYRNDYLFVFKELSDSDFEMLSRAVYREYSATGADGILEKYRRMCSVYEIDDGYINIYIPEINIPAFTIKAEIDDGCVDGDWDEVYEALDAFGEAMGSANNGSANIDLTIKKLKSSIKKQIEEAEELQMNAEE